MLSPGRLDKLLYVPLPNSQYRFNILQTITKNQPVSKDVDLQFLAFNPKSEVMKNIKLRLRNQGFSGVDLEGFVREACLNAIKEREKKEAKIEITMNDFELIFSKIFPSFKIG